MTTNNPSASAVVPPSGFAPVRTRSAYDWSSLFNGQPQIVKPESSTIESFLKNVKTQAAKAGVSLSLAVNETTGEVWLCAQTAAEALQTVPEPAAEAPKPTKSRKPAKARSAVARKRKA